MSLKRKVPSSGASDASSVARTTQKGTDAEDIERLVETDPSLVPTRPSAMLVEPSVLDQQEVQTLLADLGTLLQSAAAEAAAIVGAGSSASVNAGATQAAAIASQLNPEGALY